MTLPFGLVLACARASTPSTPRCGWRPARSGSRAASDPALRAWFEQTCTKALAAASESLESEIEAWVVRDLAHGEPTMTRLARGLATTPRTLHRRLAKSGTSFTDILDRVRRELATAYLLRQGLSVNEVAGLLGFADAGAFVRAFRRWFDTTPGQWRMRAAPFTGEAARSI